MAQDQQMNKMPKLRYGRRIPCPLQVCPFYLILHVFHQETLQTPPPGDFCRLHI